MKSEREYLSGFYPLHCEYLQKLLNSGKINHAYVITGVSEGPQRAYAELFSQQLLGDAYSLHRHPDFLRIQPTLDHHTIGVDEARSVREHLFRKPLVATRRVVCIEGGELLTVAASNALLKVLEEPPMFAVILITTAAFQQLPATVRSRMQMIHMPPLRSATVSSALREQGIEPLNTEIMPFVGGKFERMMHVLRNDDDAKSMMDEYVSWKRFLNATTAERDGMMQTYLGTGERAQQASHRIAHVLDILESLVHHTMIGEAGSDEAVHTAQRVIRIQELRTMVFHNVQKKMIFDYLTFAL